MSECIFIFAVGFITGGFLGTLLVSLLTVSKIGEITCNIQLVEEENENEKMGDLNE